MIDKNLSFNNPNYEEGLTNDDLRIVLIFRNLYYFLLQTNQQPATSNQQPAPNT